MKWARLLDGQPPWIHRPKASGRFATGLRYERKVHQHLANLALGVGVDYLEGPWIEFLDEGRRRWCQPDGLLLCHRQRQCTIVEVKYQHTVDALFQLKWLYLPICRVLFPAYIIGMLELVRWHDPSVDFHEKYDLTDSPLRIPHVNRVAVNIWNPSRAHDGIQPGRRDGSEGDGQAPGRKRSNERSDGSAGSAGLDHRRLV